MKPSMSDLDQIRHALKDLDPIPCIVDGFVTYS
jgi:hypothetical protein